MPGRRLAGVPGVAARIVTVSRRFLTVGSVRAGWGCHYRTDVLTSAQPLIREDVPPRPRPAALRRTLHSAACGLLIAGGHAACAQIPAAQLPEPVAAALRAADIPPAAVGTVVQPVAGAAGGGLALAINAAQPMNPASTMKLVTTYAALDLLGPAYTWRTEVYASGAREDGVLDGDLAVRGGGDPGLVIEQLWRLVQKIRGAGIREIRGDLLLDRGLFAPVAADPAAFDGAGLRPYNAAPDALLVNFKAVSFTFTPDADGRSVRVNATPALAGLRLPATVSALDGGCGDWRARLQGDFSEPLAPRFRGGFAAACGEKTWHVNLLEPDAYFAAVFRRLWEDGGGRWRGRVRAAPVPAQAWLVAAQESAPLAEVLRDINKFSNNVMARQLFLTLGTLAVPAATGAPANVTAEMAARVLRDWLASRRLPMPELVVENGSGLSRSERVAPASLARLLAQAYASPLMPEFVSSLPLAGVDGTMKSRQGAAGSAHVKTGLLADVRAIAGYVDAASGRRYVVVSIVNHAHAGAAAPAHDALLDWVYRNG